VGWPLTPAAAACAAVLTEDGAEHPADIVIVAVGVAPADELATSAGLECDNGIVVDQHCRTSDATIYAAGDCVNHLSPHYGRRMRLESVDNAFEQGATAALNLLGSHGTRQGAVVLVRSVRPEAHHRRHVPGI